jgi:hypothetical protein
MSAYEVPMGQVVRGRRNASRIIYQAVRGSSGCHDLSTWE